MSPPAQSPQTLSQSECVRRFPPRCCRQELPLRLAQPFLARAEIETFKAKREEFTTRNRVYCHGCRAFVPKARVDGDCAACAACALETCVICGRKWHGKSDCPKDRELDAVLELASSENWRRCRSCGALVERSFGCQHITW